MMRKISKKFSNGHQPTLQDLLNSMSSYEREMFKKFSSKHVEPDSFIVNLPLRVPEHIPRPDWLKTSTPQYARPNQEGIIYYEKEAIEKIREPAQIVAKCLKSLKDYVKIGMSANEADKFVHEFLIEHGAYPSGVGFMGFGHSVCISPNDLLCHGVPNNRVFEEGDFVNFDATCFKNGFFGDSSIMVQFGETDPLIQKLCKATQESMYEAIKSCYAGEKLSVIPKRIQEVAENYGFEVDLHFRGHGIGKYLHEQPNVSSTYSPEMDNIELKPGMIFTIEPILTIFDSGKIMYIGQDKFSVVSLCNPSAQWEHMILITEDKPEVLTLREDEFLNL